MPIDESKVLDLLKNQHLFRSKIADEINTYLPEMQNTQMENGVLTYLSNAAYGDMQDLIREVGIHRDSIPFTTANDVIELESKYVQPSDRMIHKLMNA